MESISWTVRKEKNTTCVRTQANVTSGPTRPKQMKILSCPKCGECAKNRDPNTLKLHIFHHYLHHWHDKVPPMTKKDTMCEQCTPAKRIVGANPEGCRTALICHLAIQHEELKEVMSQDSELPPSLLEDLYGVQIGKPVLVLRPGGNNHSAGDDDQQGGKEQTEEEKKAERERIMNEVRKKEMLRLMAKRKRSEVKVISSSDKELKTKRTRMVDEQERLDQLEKRLESKIQGDRGIEATGDKTTTSTPTEVVSSPKESSSNNTLALLKNFRHKNRPKSPEEEEIVALPYVKKRIKQNLKGISFDDDSDEDADWKKQSLDEAEIGRKKLPARSTRKLLDLISSESSSDEDMI